MPNCRAFDKLAHDARPQQRKEVDGCSYREARFRNHPFVDWGKPSSGEKYIHIVMFKDFMET